MGFDSLKSYFSPQFGRFDAPHPQYAADETIRIADYELLSPCEYYTVLYGQCLSGRNLKTHMWVYGEWPDCNQWQSMYDHCKKWAESDKNRSSLDAILQFERRLINERRENVKKNDVWKWRSAKDGKVDVWFSAALPDNLVRDIRKLNVDEDSATQNSASSK